MEPVGEREIKATLCLKFRPVEEMGKERPLKMWHVMWRDLQGLWHVGEGSTTQAPGRQGGLPEGRMDQCAYSLRSRC